MKLKFKCESKKDINGLIEYHKEILEETHKGLICDILDIDYKFLNIGLIEVIMSYEMEETHYIREIIK